MAAGSVLLWPWLPKASVTPKPMGAPGSEHLPSPHDEPRGTVVLTPEGPAPGCILAGVSCRPSSDWSAGSVCSMCWPSGRWGCTVSFLGEQRCTTSQEGRGRQARDRCRLRAVGGDPSPGGGGFGCHRLPVCPQLPLPLWASPGHLRSMDTLSMALSQSGRT